MKLFWLRIHRRSFYWTRFELDGDDFVAQAFTPNQTYTGAVNGCATYETIRIPRAVGESLARLDPTNWKIV